MDPGELITRVSVWLALGLYALAELGRLRWRAGLTDRLWMRSLSTLGLALFGVHVIGAFAVFHGWSHADAYASTARATAEFTGWNWGGGLYVNYLFAALWLAETLWWWLRPADYRSRPAAIDAVVRVFFLLMILNGAVVFVSGPQRWLGAGIVIAILAGFGRKD